MNEKRKPLELSKMGFDPIRVKNEKDLLQGLYTFYGKEFSKKEVRIELVSMGFARIFIEGEIGVKAALKIRPGSTCKTTIRYFINAWEVKKS